ncbi:MAG: hypothetical protein LPK58_04360 [Gammaproteobacteria bacterium]|nr:hypothetical protein [Gammaproteobacteria bacterium]
MTDPAKTRRMTNVVAGPDVGRWRCPCCHEDAPRLLPNGMPNRHPLRPADAWLHHPDVEAAVQETGAHADFDICLGCRDTVHQLLGTLVVPQGEQAELLNARGLAGTALIGAVLPGCKGQTLILVFAADGDGLRLSETIPLNDFDPGRMTYPDERGEIDPAIWAAYQAGLRRLRHGL